MLSLPRKRPESVQARNRYRFPSIASVEVEEAPPMLGVRIFIVVVLQSKIGERSVQIPTDGDSRIEIDSGFRR